MEAEKDANRALKAAIYEEFGGPVRVRDVEDPVPPRDGVVIRVEATGICRSDWHGWMGHDPDVKLPHVPGHELSGRIEAVGPDVRRWRGGEAVTVPFAVGCGVCAECRRGRPNICDDYFQPGFTAWGSFAERVAVPHADHNLVPIPDGIGFAEAATLGCRFTTAYRGVVDQGGVAPGDVVAVHGCGGVGLSAVMIARALGAEVIAIDIHPEARRLARDVGATHTVDPAEEDVPEAVRRLSGGGVQVSVDALGGAEVAFNSVLCLRKHGRHVQIGLLVGGDSPTPLPMDRVVAHELVIVGSHGMAAHAYPRLLELVTERKLDPRRLIRKTVDLGEGVRELTAMGEFRHAGITVVDRIPA